MKRLLLIALAFTSFFAMAQTKHNVNTSGTSFVPQFITIDVGDTVLWTNTGGSHNVNGTTTTYPTNPASFGNSVGSGWTYQFIFTIAGNYDYRCDPHFGIGMRGTVTVNAPAVPVTSIAVTSQSGDSTITTNGGTLQMIASVLPANATDSSVTWSVINGTGMATINASGLLQAQADGNVTARATANDSSGVFGEMDITISNQGILVTSIVVTSQSGDSTITTAGGTLQMEADVMPTNATDSTYTWSVVNGTGSATISTGGLLTATGDGTVSVVATANDASGVTGAMTVTISGQSSGLSALQKSMLSIYPNPAANVLHVKGINAEILTIVDVTGKVVRTVRATGERMQVSVSDLAPGSYFLVVTTDEGRQSVPFVKE
jgi:plastocyanin